MFVNMIDLGRRFFSQDVVTRAAGTLNEAEAGIAKAIAFVIPGTLLALAKNASVLTGGKLTALLNNAKGLTGGTTSELNSFLNEGTFAAAENAGVGTPVANLVGSLLGEEKELFMNEAASFAGIKPSSANSILNTAIPVLLTAVAEKAATDGLGETGIWAWLASQKDTIINAVPEGAGITNVLALEDITTAFAGITSKIADSTNVVSSEKGETTAKKGGGVLWIVLLLLAALAAWWFLK